MNLCYLDFRPSPCRIKNTIVLVRHWPNRMDRQRRYIPSFRTVRRLRTRPKHCIFDRVLTHKLNYVRSLIFIFNFSDNRIHLHRFICDSGVGFKKWNTKRWKIYTISCRHECDQLSSKHVLSHIPQMTHGTQMKNFARQWMPSAFSCLESLSKLSNWP